MRLFKPLVIGIVLSAITIIAVLLLPKTRGLEALSILLAAIGAVYVGLALKHGVKAIIFLETIGAAFFILMAFFGNWISPTLTAVGYIGHGVWDLAHHPRGIRLDMPGWYIPFCLAYDWIIGGFILIYF